MDMVKAPLPPLGEVGEVGVVLFSSRLSSDKDFIQEGVCEIMMMR
jgi:hypothetical protein